MAEVHLRAAVGVEALMQPAVAAETVMAATARHRLRRLRRLQPQPLRLRQQQPLRLNKFF
jgi:hypothetical protein